VTAAAAARPAGGSGCRLRWAGAPDLPVLIVSSPDLRLAFLPAVGGRLISLRAAGMELLWRNPAYLDAALHPVRPYPSWPRPDATMASWANVGGSKTWPAPQGWSGPGEWPGPPDAVLDAGPYRVHSEVDSAGTASVRLVSGVDPRTGLQVTRGFSVPPAGVDFGQRITFRNRGPRPVRWAIWEVAQVDTGPGGRGLFRVEQAAAERPVHLVSAVGTPRYELHAGAVDVPVQDVVGKLGFPAATGTVTWIRDGRPLLRLRTTRHRGPYPDGGCPVELWLQFPRPHPLPQLDGLHPTAHLVEMEVLGPLAELPPGGQTSLDVHWTGPAPA
jgi:hypothetical protein